MQKHHSGYIAINISITHFVELFINPRQKSNQRNQNHPICYGNEIQHSLVQHYNMHNFKNSVRTQARRVAMYNVPKSIRPHGSGCTFCQAAGKPV